MRHQIKTELGSNVLDRQQKAGAPQTAEQAKDRWTGFSSKRTTVRNQLLAQQFNLCGYTEFQISDFYSISQSKLGCHIVHHDKMFSFPSAVAGVF
jgi:hypothetical protein